MRNDGISCVAECDCRGQIANLPYSRRFISSSLEIMAEVAEIFPSEPQAASMSKQVNVRRQPPGLSAGQGADSSAFIRGL